RGAHHRSSPGSSSAAHRPSSLTITQPLPSPPTIITNLHQPRAETTAICSLAVADHREEDVDNLHPSAKQEDSSLSPSLHHRQLRRGRRPTPISAPHHHRQVLVHRPPPTTCLLRVIYGEDRVPVRLRNHSPLTALKPSVAYGSVVVRPYSCQVPLMAVDDLLGRRRFE
ncbi:hypothetical protein Dimus_001562, partial [Dionaea muscipula]